MNMDMSQFIQVFIEESTELLDDIENILVNLEDCNIDEDQINQLFRAAHSIKGGSGTFGLTHISEFTHVVETYLDKVRDGLTQLDDNIVSLLLEFVDMTREMLDASNEGSEYDEANAARLKKEFEKLVERVESGDTVEVASDDKSENEEPQTEDDELQALFDSVKEESSASIANGWVIEFKPSPDIIQNGNKPFNIIKELSELGQLRTKVNDSDLPPLQDMNPTEIYLQWRFELLSDKSEAEIKEEVFSWVEIDSDITFEPLTGEKIETLEQDCIEATVPDEPKKEAEVKKVSGKATQAKKQDMGSIRVDTSKVDALINIVGEIIITQSMLNQLAEKMAGEDIEELKKGIGLLKQNSRELQESVMRIRMLPISVIFNRFPRLIRDISGKLGKKIDFIVSGESTELDKGIIEKLSDPLVHLIRNGLDHGIESTEKRLEAGKPETGKLLLNAYHQGGNVIIELIDDGAGLNKDKILSKAIENGIVDPNVTYSENEINTMIFLPGFSTADEVTDISGRGVGMDVVRRNIQELGGSIDVESEEGKGSKFTIRLPLTLSILDGQLTGLGSQTFIIPLTNIIETIQIMPDEVNMVTSESHVYSLRDEFIPLIRLSQIFDIPSTTVSNKIFVVIVEAKNKKYGIIIDELFSQQQIVLKNIDHHYKHIEGVSGATILGDGTIALIIDIEGVVSLFEKTKDATNETTHATA